jgi:concanavalin A-like lectin/glucanase superfamily protein
MKRFISAVLAITMCLVFSAQGQYSQVNYVLSLNGSSYISVPYSINLNYFLSMNGKMSIDAWVYPTSLSTQMTIVGNEIFTGYWLGTNTSGKVLFQPNPYEQHVSTTALPLNTWTHVAVSYSVASKSVQIYLNGKLNLNKSILQPYIQSSGGEVFIGADKSATTADRYWRGRLDEVRIWDNPINYATAQGLLYRVPHAVVNGLHGRYLVAGWRLNANGNDIAGAANGTPVGGPVFLRAPLPPHYSRICAHFTNIPSGPTAGGSLDCIDLPRSSSLSLISNYSLEAWIKPATTNGHTNYQTIVQKGSKYMSTWSYWLGLDKKNSRLYFVPNGDFGNGLLSTVTIPNNQWTHVAATYRTLGKSNHVATVYVNGLPKGTKTFTTLASTNTELPRIGASDGPNAPPNPYGFSGSIDELRMWTTARTADEVADNYRREFSGPHSGLLAVYHFDGDVFDRSGNALNGYRVLPASSTLYFRSSDDLPPYPYVEVMAPDGGETWVVGEKRQISWRSDGLHNVRVELSRNGGASFQTLTNSVPASPALFNWTVTDPATSSALVRITTPSFTPVADTSDATFNIQPPPVIRTQPQALNFSAARNGPIPADQLLLLTNAGGGTLSWYIEVKDSVWLTVVPSSGVGNNNNLIVRILTTNLPEGLHSDTIFVLGNASNSPHRIPVDYLISSEPLFEVRGKISNSTAQNPPQSMEGILVRLDGPSPRTATTDESGEYWFIDIRPGAHVVTPVDPYLDFSPPERKYNPLNSNIFDADFEASARRGRMTLSYTEGWNLLSIPLWADEIALSVLVPDAIPPAYAYVQEQGYVDVSTMEFGQGYWVRCSRAGSVEIAGLFQRSLSLDLLAAAGGWNLVGTPSGQSDFAHMTQTPANIIAKMYGFDAFNGYTQPPAGIVVPGKGYWLKVDAAGNIFMEPSVPFGPVPPPWKFSDPKATLKLEPKLR